MIGQMQEILTFSIYTLSQTASGGTDKTFASSYTDWCEIKETNGSRTLEQMQIDFKKVYKITKRHYDDIDADLTTIEYKGKTLSIANVKVITESRASYDEITAYQTN